MLKGPSGTMENRQKGSQRGWKEERIVSEKTRTGRTRIEKE